MAIIKGTYGDDIITPTRISAGVSGGRPSGAADTITGSNGNDLIDGGGGNDTIDGGRDNDTINGGAGNDFLDGGSGIDVLNGGDGNDTFAPRVDNDVLNGGAGYDRILTTERYDSIYLNAFDSTTNGIEEIVSTASTVGRILADNSANVFDFSKTKLVNLYVDAGWGDDRVRGSDLTNDIIDGGYGRDTLYGGGGNDTIDGESDNDTIYGDAGDDSLIGNTGNDKLFGGVGNDSLDGGGGNDKLSGQAGDDTLTGGGGNDRLLGGAGNDMLIDGGDYTGTSDDVLYGGAGNDTLDGGADDDVLYGEAGNDVLIGRTGFDQLSGGSGNDIFRYYDTIESRNIYAQPRDLILDFAKGDRIDLSNIDANEDVAGNQAFVFRGTGSLTGLGQVRVVAAGQDTLIQAKTDYPSSSGVQLEILVKGVAAATWTAADFIL